LLDKKNIAVFLDRDGTINEEVNFVKSVEELKLIPCAARAINRMNDLDLRTIVLSNQSGIARGFFTEKELNEINTRLLKLLKIENATIDSIYYCPHHPEGVVKEFAINCDCRKPKTGMILKAAKEFNINVEKSFVIGDMMRDLECGKNAGTKNILVLTGKGRETLNEIKTNSFQPDFIAHDLIDAVKYIENNIF
jgi:D-glycero-D-manno-heptose 1,7-bisphosphate phosphatase